MIYLVVFICLGVATNALPTYPIHPGVGAIYKGPNSETIIKGPDGSIITAAAEGGEVATNVEAEPVVVQPVVETAPIVVETPAAVIDTSAAVVSQPVISTSIIETKVVQSPVIAKTAAVQVLPVEIEDGADIEGPSGAISTRGSKSIVAGPASTTYSGPGGEISVEKIDTIEAAPAINTISVVSPAPVLKVSTVERLAPVIAAAPIVHTVTPAPILNVGNIATASVHAVSPAPVLRAPIVHDVSPATILASPTPFVHTASPTPVLQVASASPVLQTPLVQSVSSGPILKSPHSYRIPSSPIVNVPSPVFTSGAHFPSAKPATILTAPEISSYPGVSVNDGLHSQTLLSSHVDNSGLHLNAGGGPIFRAPVPHSTAVLQGLRGSNSLGLEGYAGPNSAVLESAPVPHSTAVLQDFRGSNSAVLDGYARPNGAVLQDFRGTNGHVLQAPSLSDATVHINGAQPYAVSNQASANVLYNPTERPKDVLVVGAPSNPNNLLLNKDSLSAQHLEASPVLIGQGQGLGAYGNAELQPYAVSNQASANVLYNPTERPKDVLVVGAPSNANHLLLNKDSLSAQHLEASPVLIGSGQGQAQGLGLGAYGNADFNRRLLSSNGVPLSNVRLSDVPVIVEGRDNDVLPNSAANLAYTQQKLLGRDGLANNAVNYAYTQENFAGVDPKLSVNGVNPNIALANINPGVDSRVALATADPRYALADASRRTIVSDIPVSELSGHAAAGSVADYENYNEALASGIIPKAYYKRKA